MPSNRRIRLLFYIVLAGCITMLFFTNHLRQNQVEPDTRSIQDFYHKTKSAVDRARAAGGRNSGQTVLDAKTGKEAGRTPVDKDADGDVDSDDEVLARQMSERLKAAEAKAKELANAKAPNKPDSPGKVVGVGSSAGGQVKKAGGDGADEKQEVLEGTEETAEERELEAEVQRILKKAPMVIFSKSYCPYSKRAKGILLDKYHIEPAPYVVELDEHPMGSKIQDRLQEMTGRRTVPNILISGKSIGGSDDIVALDNQKALAEKITSLNQKISVEQRFVEGEKDI